MRLQIKEFYKLFFSRELDAARVGEEGEDGEAGRVVAGRGEAGRVNPTVPSWKGDKLFPPIKTTKQQSKAWRYGGFRKKESGELDISKAVCGLCGEEFKYASSPFPLAQHLKRHHEDQVDLGKQEAPAIRLRQASVKDFIEKKLDKVKKYPNHNAKQKKFRKQLLHLIVRSKRPISIVEDQELVESYAIADPRLSVPSKQTMTRDIKKVFKEVKAKKIEEFSDIEWFNCTNDAGSTSGARSFVDVNVHYLSETFVLHKKILRVFEMKEAKNADNYRSRISESMEQFGIASKVATYTTDNEATMEKAFRSDKRNGCFAHIESKSCQKVLKRQKQFTKLRKKLKRLSKKANKSNKFRYAVENQQKKRNLKMLHLQQEVATRFTATWIMARSFLNIGKLGEEVGDERMQANFDAINAAMVEAGFKKKDLEDLKLTTEDLIKLKELVKVKKTTHQF